ncbi:hypothetical protein M885DRAFT_610617 [Pelagophyceae sp. CCMP2097]|nr:hypothetical protein M885DRAFT_610617 [Pelagophyceae sp. CCMP2097]
MRGGMPAEPGALPSAFWIGARSAPQMGEARDEMKAMDVETSGSRAEPTWTDEATWTHKRRTAATYAFGIPLVLFVLYCALLAAAPAHTDVSDVAGLRLAILDKGRAASAAGVLKGANILTAATVLDGGAPFVVSLAAPSQKPAPMAGALEIDPFDDVSLEDLLVVRRGVFGGRYNVILNKFATIPGHALLVTASFELQSSEMTALDLDALHRVAEASHALGFFNSGPVSGASQLHRHFQLVPEIIDGARTPIRAAVDNLPEEPWFLSSTAPFRPAVRDLWAFAGISHGVLRLPPRATFHIDFEFHGSYGDALLRAFIALSDHVGLAPEEDFNLLVADDFMLLARRESESFAGIHVNALGFAGYLLAHDAAAFEKVLASGPLDVLRHVAPLPG